MSLQVWLPLTKDTRNQGVANVTVTNSGATYNTNGKLGGSYYFNRSSSNYLKVTNPITTASNGVSMAFWVKLPIIASGNNQIIHIGNGAGWNNNRFTVFVRSGYSYLCFSISGGANESSSQYTYVSSSLTLDEWTHVACTYESGQVKIYLNGALDKQYTTTFVPSFSDTPFIGIGAAPNAAEPVTAYLNDVRIYNHCLSLMEVKELAKGLVLHYLLSDNNLESTINIFSTANNDRGVAVDCTSTTMTGYYPNQNVTLSLDTMLNGLQCVRCPSGRSDRLQCRQGWLPLLW